MTKPAPKPQPTEKYVTLPSGNRMLISELTPRQINAELERVTAQQERAWLLADLLERSEALARRREALTASGYTVIERDLSWMALSPEGSDVLPAPAPSEQDAWRRLAQTVKAD